MSNENRILLTQHIETKFSYWIYPWIFDRSLNLSQIFGSFWILQIFVSCRSLDLVDIWILQIFVSCRSLDLVDLWRLQIFGSCRSLNLVDLWRLQIFGSCRSLDLVDLWILQISESCRSLNTCLLYTSPSPRDATLSRMPSSA